MYDLSKIDAVAAALGTFDRDCAITVALKIVDDSCKMDAYEKSVFLMLYKALADRSSELFDPSVFDLVEEAESRPSANCYARIKPLRQAAMDAITRPKMKAFKAQIRRSIAH